MQTTKFLFAIGAAAILAAPLQVTAGPDNEAQAKMREALRQKMEELNAQSAAAPTAPTAPVAPVAPAPAAPPAPVVKPVEPKPAPAPVVIAPTVVVPVPAEPVAAPAPVQAKATDSRFSEVPDASEDAQAARIREALRQKIAAEKAAIATATAAPAPAPAPTVSAPAKPAAVVQKPVVVQPVATNIEAAPASPLSGSKQERLAALLQLYKADTITPQQYHTQRAAIIAEP
jgi:hypothetical protein